MTYRDDLEAAHYRSEALARELADVQRRLGDRAELEVQARELAGALAEARRQVAHARARSSLPLLQQIKIASPCQERWDDMTGDERARHCGRCDKQVYDLSALTAAAAEALLAAHGEGLCVRFYRRADGTVLTSDCPDGARRRRRRRITVASAALVASSLATGGVVRALSASHAMGKAYQGGPSYEMGGTGAPPPAPAPPPEVMMGEMEAPVAPGERVQGGISPLPVAAPDAPRR